jgi:multiple sugar transport system permease protein
MRTLSVSRKVGTFWSYVLVILVCSIFFAPFLYLVSTALKSSQQVIRYPRTLFVRPFHGENFLTIFSMYPVAMYFKNTILVVIGSIAGNLIVSSLTGYALARMNFKGRELLFNLTLACMFMPLFLIIIPRFLFFQKIHTIGTLLPLILPSAFGSPFCIYLMRQFLKGIPKEMGEAAKIDGCSEFMTFRKVIMPLAKPVLATIVIFTTQWRWNEFTEPLIYLNNQKLYTITMGLYNVIGMAAEEINTHLVMAFVIVSIIPILALFAFSQRSFVKGISTTGLKG